jgi:hypothetical protein
MDGLDQAERGELSNPAIVTNQPKVAFQSFAKASEKPPNQKDSEPASINHPKESYLVPYVAPDSLGLGSTSNTGSCNPD